VQSIFDDLGLELDAVTGNVAPTKQEVGRAYDADPTGTLDIGDTVTVSFYDAIPDPDQPGVVTPTATTVAPGEIFTVNWSTYTGCPTDHELTGFEFLVNNGTAEKSNPIDDGETELNITAGNVGQTTIKYRAVCGDINSAYSEAATVTVAAEEPVTP
jgi:serine/threonine-protein kinase